MIINSWRSRCDRKPNPSKSNDMISIVSRLRSQLPQHSSLLINAVLITPVNNLKLMLTFVLQIGNMAQAVSHKLNIIRKCKGIYEDDSMTQMFFIFHSESLEYCSPVWLSAADSYLRLLDLIKILYYSHSISLTDSDLDIRHRRNVGALSVLYKIRIDNSHPLYKVL